MLYYLLNLSIHLDYIFLFQNEHDGSKNGNDDHSPKRMKKLVAIDSYLDDISEQLNSIEDQIEERSKREPIYTAKGGTCISLFFFLSFFCLKHIYKYIYIYVYDNNKK